MYLKEKFEADISNRNPAPNEMLFEITSSRGTEHVSREQLVRRNYSALLDFYEAKMRLP
jgi:hypothetical protein